MNEAILTQELPKTMADTYAEHFRAAYAVLRPSSKRIIDAMKTKHKLTLEQELWAIDWFKRVTERAEKYFDEKNALKTAS